jgi:hypothetical protein
MCRRYRGDTFSCAESTAGNQVRAPDMVARIFRGVSDGLVLWESVDAETKVKRAQQAAPLQILLEYILGMSL